jgi:hypothetical protein
MTAMARAGRRRGARLRWQRAGIATVPPVKVVQKRFASPLFRAVGNPSHLAVDPTKPLVRMTITRMATSSLVPEPASYALAVVGALAVLALGRRKRSS